MFRCASTNEIPSDSRAAVATKTSETPDYSDGGKKKVGGNQNNSLESWLDWKITIFI